MNRRDFLQLSLASSAVLLIPGWKASAKPRIRISGFSLLNGAKVDLCELAGDSKRLDDLIFQDCTIRGPALVVPERNAMIANCWFHAPASDPTGVFKHVAMLCEGTPTIRVARCSFIACDFHEVVLWHHG